MITAPAHQSRTTEFNEILQSLTGDYLKLHALIISQQEQLNNYQQN